MKCWCLWLEGRNERIRSRKFGIWKLHIRSITFIPYHYQTLVRCRTVEQNCRPWCCARNNLVVTNLPSSYTIQYTKLLVTNILIFRKACAILNYSVGSKKFTLLVYLFRISITLRFQRTISVFIKTICSSFLQLSKFRIFLPRLPMWYCIQKIYSLMYWL